MEGIQRMEKKEKSRTQERKKVHVPRHGSLSLFLCPGLKAVAKIRWKNVDKYFRKTTTTTITTNTKTKTLPLPFEVNRPSRMADEKTKWLSTEHGSTPQES